MILVSYFRRLAVRLGVYWLVTEYCTGTILQKP